VIEGTTVNYRDLYARVTTAVVAQIEAGASEWRMPWRAIAEVGQPVNASTGLGYRGGNHMLFAMVAQAQEWGGYWATYKQWQALGVQVRRGERGTRGVHWSTVVRTRQGDGEDVEGTSGARRLVPHVFTVFNSAQVEGWTPPEEAPRDTPARIAAAEAFFAAIGADVRHGGNRAAYAPSLDAIMLPDLDQFGDAASYYATTAHEHAHWTGHRSRLARDLSGRFGSDSYAAEELVAELSAAFTCSLLGISTVPRPDHAAYLASWLRVLRADPSALFHAASNAQAATDYLAERAGAGMEVAA
jgi:antirestriction protein ArdC